MPFYNRKNHRLKNYDYGRYGYYYVTICTNHRARLLSTITLDEQSQPSLSTNPIVGSDALVAPKPQTFCFLMGRDIV